MSEKFNQKEQEFLKNIQSENEADQLKAWTSAGEMDPAVIAVLGELLVSPNIKIAKAADEAIKQITHSVGKKLSGARWEKVVQEYLDLAKEGNPQWSRAIALRQLSVIGKDETVKAVAPIITETPDLAEEAVFCLERIPGKAATLALADSLSKVPDNFKHRILAALGHRADAAALDTIVPYMASSDQDLAISAMKAVARIGESPTGDVKLPNYSDLSERNRSYYVDSWLRYWDYQVENGNTDDPLKGYQYVAENNEEEHFRCAAIVGLSKIGNSSAKAVIEKCKEDEAYIVRITAEKALE